ncbi:MAG: ATP-binding protein [Alphaproteobacteria bacterium]|nr:ATP-binding protein [Alphaproteobacteria bacterium]
MTYYDRILAISRRYNLASKLPYVLSVMAIVCGFMTYWALTRDNPLGEKSRFIIFFIYLDLTILLLLAVVIARRLVELWIEHRRGLKGSKLHVHIVALFAFVSITPAIFVAIFSALFFNIGVDAWFGKPVQDALQQANVVAESYLKEHKKSIGIDIESLKRLYAPHMAYIIESREDSEKQEKISEDLSNKARDRGLAEILIFEGHKNPRTLGRSYFTISLMLEDLKESLTKAHDKPGDLVIIDSTVKDRVRALIMLDQTTNTYLLVGKFIDTNVLKHVDLTKSAIKDYAALENHRADVQVTFVVFFSIVALLLLMAAIWVGLIIADLMVKPITKLIEAAQAVAEGDLTIKLETHALNNEIDDLCRSFNRMTHQLLQQKQDLILSEKKSTWADMARKIAHEIKNPLTPIQLSAERLKRRYLKEITTDPDTFKACVDTIIRQVGSIGSLVNEFSNFARMPEPKLESIDWIELCQQSLFLQSQAHPEIDLAFESDFKTYSAMVDPLQMGQVLTNLLQNSINAVVENQNSLSNPKIRLRLYEENSILYISIDDNGPGFPVHERNKLLEPYYTTRERGTGLGLAIVTKIVSDHYGRIELEESKNLGGASVVLSFPKRDKKEKDANECHTIS